MTKIGLGRPYEGNYIMYDMWFPAANLAEIRKIKAREKPSLIKNSI